MKLIVDMGTHPNGGVHRYGMAKMGKSDMGFITGMGTHPNMGVHRYSTGMVQGRSSGQELGTWTTGLHVIGIEGLCAT